MKIRFDHIWHYQNNNQINVVVKTISLSGTGRKMRLIIGNHSVSFLAYTIWIFSCSRIKVTHEKNWSVRVKSFNVVFKIFRHFREKVFWAVRRNIDATNINIFWGFYILFANFWTTESLELFFLLIPNYGVHFCTVKQLLLSCNHCFLILKYLKLPIDILLLR